MVSSGFGATWVARECGVGHRWVGFWLLSVTISHEEGDIE